MFFWHKPGVMIKILQDGLCLKNLMGLDVFGLEVLCIPEMVTDFSLQNGLLKTGPKVNSMVNYLLVEDNFLKQYQQLRKELPLTHNGKM